MKYMKILKYVNLLLGLAFITAAAGVILSRFGWEAIRGSETVYEIHEFAGTAFILLALLHIFLNRKWLKNVYFKTKKQEKS